MSWTVHSAAACIFGYSAALAASQATAYDGCHEYPHAARGACIDDFDDADAARTYDRSGLAVRTARA